MFASAAKAFAVMAHPGFRGVFWRSLALTIVLFVLLFAGVVWGLAAIPPLPLHWLNTLIGAISALAFVVAMIFLGPPVAALFATLFLGGIAREVERTSYPGDPPAREIPFWTGLSAGLRLFLLVAASTVLLLPFDVELPGVGEFLTFSINGWLLGREFFELAALRHLSPAEAAAMRGRHGFVIWLAGLWLSLLTLIPGVNLFAPLYGSALMVHLFKRFAQQEQSR